MEINVATCFPGGVSKRAVTYPKELSSFVSKIDQFYEMFGYGM